jgi:hypothetical protein
MGAFGTSGLIKQPGAKYVVAKNGLATYDLQYRGVLESEIPVVQGDAPMDDKYPFMVLLNFSVTEGDNACNEIILDMHYEGHDTVHTRRYVSEELTVDLTTSNEPIESHPDFVTKIGGKLGAAKHGAIFDPSTGGKFEFFPIVDPDEPLKLPGRLTGVTSYLMPQLSITQNDIQDAWPTTDELALVGKIVIPPFSNPPTLPGTRNWLYNGLRIRNIANVCFETQRVYLESGPRGWIKEIYEPAIP